MRQSRRPAGSLYALGMADAYVVDAVRSPIGRRNGSLSEIRADELAAQVLNGLVGRVDLDPGEIEDVQMGCVTQVGEQALNVGRGAVLVAGWPETVVRDHRRPPVRLLAAGCVQRRVRDPGGSPRPRRRRGRRAHDPRADGLEPRRPRAGAR